MSSDDHYSQGVFTTSSEGTNFGGVHTRYSAAADTCYQFHWRWDGTAGTHNIAKFVTGTPTILVTGTSDPASGATFKGQSAATDTHTAFLNGSSTISVVDSAITGNLRPGFSLQPRTVGKTDTCDAFEAADLAAAAFDLDRIERRTMRGHMRGLMRGT